MSSVSGSQHGFQLGSYTVRWRCCRARRQPASSLAMAVTMLAASVWVGGTLGLGWAAGALAAQLMATWSWWLPLRCEAGPRGLLLYQGGRRRRIPWARMRIVHWEPGRCVLDYRGRNGAAQKHLVLSWPPRREDVSQTLRHYLQQKGAGSFSTETVVPVGPPVSESSPEQGAQTERFSTSPLPPAQNPPSEEQKPDP